MLLLFWGLALLCAGLLLVLLEVFVPSGGMIALLSAVVGIAGIVCLFMYEATWGIAGTLAAMVLVPIIVAFGFKVMPTTYFGKKMLFGESGKHEPVLPEAPTTEFDALVGMEGEAVTDLRPVGTIKVDGQKLDALSEVSYVRAGTRIKVTAVEGVTIKVRPIV